MLAGGSFGAETAAGWPTVSAPRATGPKKVPARRRPGVAARDAVGPRVGSRARTGSGRHGHRRRDERIRSPVNRPPVQARVAPCRDPAAGRRGALARVRSADVYFRRDGWIRLCSPAEAAGLANRRAVTVAQLVRAPGCGPGGRGFDSHQSPQTRVTRSVAAASRSRCGGVSPSGKAADFGSAIAGSNPATPARRGTSS